MKPKREPRAISPAKRYAAPKDLWIVSTYFDSEGYSSKLRALRSYLRSVDESGIPLLLVEGAFGKRPFLLPESERVLHVRCPSVMWQKERLLNVAIKNLPPSCRKVAWLDTDIFFENPRWAVETSELLDRVPVVQPFDVALWLPKGTTRFRGRGITWPGFAAVAQRHPGLFLSGDFDRHGHSGYAWAARRDVVEQHGLYDRSVVGSGDHLMAHAMMGDLSSPCVTNSVGSTNPFRESFHAWAKPFHRAVRSTVGFVGGAVLHRWHGDRKKRRYYKRMVGLLARRYDPSLDVRVSISGALEWTEHGAALGRWMKDYFTGRQEDARPGSVEEVSWDALERLRNDRSSPLDASMQPFAQLLGPLATLVSEQSDEWIGAGLTPVLPNLIAAMISTSSHSRTESGQSDWPSSPSLGFAAKQTTIPEQTSLPAYLQFYLAGASGTHPALLEDGESDAAPRALLQWPLPPVSRVRPMIPRPVWMRGDGSDTFEVARSILRVVLHKAKQTRAKNPRRWSRLAPETRWALLSETPENQHRPLAEELNVRVRDPRWNDAPELRSASRQLLKRRAKFAAQKGEPSDPFDAVVGPGSSAAGLDHV